ncbi:CPBP family intramembrane glutamic endopeptidase [Cohnella mopanensis]|uniref:CPBP family intramembrane glutamic endopeptidase n=1 Tax=Cohnella mopanensis TaxID=2911966 RepID=UPI001EF7EEEE|nr:type II CAAX endopeptidase family protein [Cohnella mopanensis]
MIKVGNIIKSAAAVIGKILLSLALVFGIVFIIVLLQIVTSATKDANGEIQVEIGYGDLFNFGMMGAFIIASLAMYLWFERKKGWSLGFKQRSSSVFALHGLAGGILLISLSSVIIWAMGGISWEAAEWNQELVQSLLWGILLYVCAAFSEEIFSRGYVQGLIRHHYGPKMAIVASSLLFAILHGMNPGTFDSPFPIIVLILAGVIMSVAREVTGGLWWSIGLHLSWNYFQGYVYGFKVSGTDVVPAVLHTTDNGPSSLSGGTFGAEGSYVSIVVLIIGIVGVYYLYGRKSAVSAPTLAQ